jgi:hypothetical protein
MPKKTLPRATAPGALYVLAVAAGVLLSKPLAIVLAALATVVLALVLAGTQVLQRRLPDLGRLPFVDDHRFYERLHRSTGATAPELPATQPQVQMLPTGGYVDGKLAGSHWSASGDQRVPLRPPDQRSPRGRLEAHAERGKEILARFDKTLEKYSTSLDRGGLLDSVQVQGSLLVTERDGWIATATGLVERLAPNLLDEYNTNYVVGVPTVPALGAAFHRLREPLRQRLGGLHRVIDAMEDQ